jgi:hypothetical protein
MRTLLGVLIWGAVFFAVLIWWNAPRTHHERVLNAAYYACQNGQWAETFEDENGQMEKTFPSEKACVAYLYARHATGN